MAPIDGPIHTRRDGLSVPPASYPLPTVSHAFWRLSIHRHGPLRWLCLFLVALHRRDAEAGNEDAQWSVALWLWRAGRPEQALAHFLQMADGGNVPATVNAGIIHAGRGDDGLAVPLFERAASQGDPIATYAAGVAHLRLGHDAQALSYLSDARDFGHPTAASLIALFETQDRKPFPVDRPPTDEQRRT